MKSKKRGLVEEDALKLFQDESGLETQAAAAAEMALRGFKMRKLGTGSIYECKDRQDGMYIARTPTGVVNCPENTFTEIALGKMRKREDAEELLNAYFSSFALGVKRIKVNDGYSASQTLSALELEDDIFGFHDGEEDDEAEGYHKKKDKGKSSNGDMFEVFVVDNHELRHICVKSSLEEAAREYDFQIIVAFRRFGAPLNFEEDREKLIEEAKSIPWKEYKKNLLKLRQRSTEDIDSQDDVEYVRERDETYTTTNTTLEDVDEIDAILTTASGKRGCDYDEFYFLSNIPVPKKIVNPFRYYSRSIDLTIPRYYYEYFNYPIAISISETNIYHFSIMIGRMIENINSNPTYDKRKIAKNTMYTLDALLKQGDLSIWNLKPWIFCAISRYLYFEQKVSLLQMDNTSDLSSLVEIRKKNLENAKDVIKSIETGQLVANPTWKLPLKLVRKRAPSKFCYDEIMVEATIRLVSLSLIENGYDAINSCIDDCKAALRAIKGVCEQTLVILHSLIGKIYYWKAKKAMKKGNLLSKIDIENQLDSFGKAFSNFDKCLSLDRTRVIDASELIDVFQELKKVINQKKEEIIKRKKQKRALQQELLSSQQTASQASSLFSFSRLSTQEEDDNDLYFDDDFEESIPKMNAIVRNYSSKCMQRLETVIREQNDVPDYLQNVSMVKHLMKLREIEFKENSNTSLDVTGFWKSIDLLSNYARNELNEPEKPINELDRLIRKILLKVQKCIEEFEEKKRMKKSSSPPRVQIPFNRLHSDSNDDDEDDSNSDNYDDSEESMNNPDNKDDKKVDEDGISQSLIKRLCSSQISAINARRRLLISLTAAAASQIDHLSMKDCMQVGISSSLVISKRALYLWELLTVSCIALGKSDAQQYIAGDRIWWKHRFFNKSYPNKNGSMHNDPLLNLTQAAYNDSIKVTRPDEAARMQKWAAYMFIVADYFDFTDCQQVVGRKITSKVILPLLFNDPKRKPYPFEKIVQA